MLAALEKAGAKAVGRGDDRRLDVGLPGRQAAKVRSIGVLTGGFSEPELLDAGASEVFASVDDLRKDLDGGVLRV